jgi:hypothetical protein
MAGDKAWAEGDEKGDAEDAPFPPIPWGFVNVVAESVE